jgi:hypothetical protein
MRRKNTLENCTRIYLPLGKLDEEERIILKNLNEIG